MNRFHGLLLGSFLALALPLACSSSTSTPNPGGGGGNPGSGGSAGSGSASCPTGQVSCAGACVTLSSNSANCGACGSQCAVGSACVAGACACQTGSLSCRRAMREPRGRSQQLRQLRQQMPEWSGIHGGQNAGINACQCAAGLVNCASSCVDVSSSATNCGTCGTACAANPGVLDRQPAKRGCDQGLVQCGQSCVNTQTSLTNCGACNTTCAAGQVCAGGQCGCSTGQTLCTGQCVASQTDPLHCGGWRHAVHRWTHVHCWPVRLPQRAEPSALVLASPGRAARAWRPGAGAEAAAPGAGGTAGQQWWQLRGGGGSAGGPPVETPNALTCSSQRQDLHGAGRRRDLRLPRHAHHVFDGRARRDRLVRLRRGKIPRAAPPPARPPPGVGSNAFAIDATTVGPCNSGGALKVSSTGNDGSAGWGVGFGVNMMPNPAGSTKKVAFDVLQGRRLHRHRLLHEVPSRDRLCLRQSR